MSLKKFRRKITYSNWFVDTLATAAALFILLYYKTLKVRCIFHPDFRELNRNHALYGFWHGRQFLLVPTFGKWNISLMSDISWAGEVQSRILSHIGYTVIRGSSKRKGMQALLNMKRIIVEESKAGAFALDGPSGPPFHSKPGIIFLAKKLDFPIVPLISSADKPWFIKKTWCNYMLPRPFSRCLVAMGGPVWPNREEHFESGELDTIVVNWMKQTDKKVGRNSISL